MRSYYSDAFHTAHLEVPGEMFELAMQAQEKGRGVVGSTSNILNFILKKTREAVWEQSSNSSGRKNSRLKFVLGTEAGMVTSIVRGVQKILQEAPGVEVEIIFPVSAEAISTGTTSAYTSLSTIILLY